VGQLDADQMSEVTALVEAAASVDGVAPLSEQTLLDARLGDTAGTTSSPHLLAYAGPQLAGYAHLERGPGAHSGVAATAELVVDPGLRRQGVGTLLIRALEDALQPDALTFDPDPETPQPDSLTLPPEAATLQIWSHGDLDGARALAAREGYSSVRELWSMRRSLRTEAAPLLTLPLPEALVPEGRLPEVQLPEGFTARQFVVGQDEDAWLRVNARAFVDHPEQGRMTRLDLDRRIAQSWFDATGFILIEDVRGQAPVLAASHWTKVVPAEDPQVSPSEGEVYVVGVDPAYQGLGLGRAVTVMGLVHLVERGLAEAVLYVDADNAAAVATYSRLGFSRFAVDVMYARAVHPRVPR
jgi:mycothiol synthase